MANKVKAKRKIAWVHTDYSQININVKSELKMWDMYDYIVSISEAVSKGFLKVFPSLQGKLFIMENILPEKLIRQQAMTENVDSQMAEHGIRILSIGRYCAAKNFDNVPDICRRLCEKGLDIYWYIIGFGGEEDLIRQKIKDSGMSKRVILLGKKENPYPYIKNCDMYVQPSRYEGKSVSVREAQILGKHVVITNYATAVSQLKDGVDGVIVPMDNAGCADGIVRVLNNRPLLETLKNNCLKNDYSNSKEVQKLYSLLD